MLFLSYFSTFGIQIELVTNGDFSNNYNGFTSDYSQNTSLTSDGRYTINSNPSSVNGGYYNFYDHTVGTSGGKMLIANASISNFDIWKNNIYVTAGNTYTLSFWTRMADNATNSTLAWMVNGVQVGTSIGTTTGWQQISVVYTATSTGFVTFSIQELTKVSSGNLFVLDDVSILENITPTCSGKFYDSGGSLGNYSDNENYYQTFCANPGQNIRFNFTSFQTRDNKDYLEIFDGSLNTNIGVYNGNSSPGTITSSEQCLVFHFVSNNKDNRLGWEADISCVSDPACNTISQVLINDLVANNDVDITNGGTYYLSQLPTNWNLEAVSAGSGSIFFEISGNFSGSSTDNTSAYRYPSTSGNLNLGAGTYQIKVQYFENDNKGGSLCDEKTITLILDNCNAAGFAITSNSPVCNGSALNLSAVSLGAGTIYSWVGPDGFNSTLQSPIINGVNATKAGNYFCTANLSGCSATASAAVIIKDSPSAVSTKINPNCGLNNGSISFAFTDNPTFSSIQFSTNGGSSYSTAVNDITGTYSISSLGPATYDLYVRWGTGECPVNLSDQTLTRFSGTLTPSANASICYGLNTTLSVSLNNAVGITTYSWSNGLGNGNSKVVSPTSNTTYSVTGTDSEGCTASATVSVTVNSLPIPGATSNSPVCDGGTIAINASGGTSYSWTGPGLGATSGSTLTRTNATYAMEGTYTLMVTDANNCQASTSVFIDINTTVFPTASVINSSICSGQNLDFTSSGADTYTWAGPNSFTSSIQSPQIVSAAIAATGTYTVTGRLTAGCTATATVYASVVAGNVSASNDGPQCEGINISLSATGGSAYSWVGPDSFTASLANPTVSNTRIPNSEGIYTVTITVTPSCQKTATTNLSLYSPPNIVVSNDGPVCAGSTLTLNATGGVSNSWTGPSGFTSSALSPTISNMNISKAGIYSVTVTNASGCTASATTEVVLSFPSLVVSPDTALCAGGTLNLHVSGAVSYSWSGPNGFSSGASNPVLNNVSSVNSGIYTITANNSLGCSATNNIEVTVLYTNQAIISNSPKCVGKQIDFDYPGWSTYSWTGPDSFSSTISNPIINNVNSLKAGIYSLTASVNGCTTTATTNVIVNALPVINISGNTPVCLGTTLSLGSGGGTIYQWSGPLGYSSTSSNPSFTVNDSLYEGTYKVIVTTASGCIDSSTKFIDVSYVIPVTSNNSPACIGGNVLLFSSGGNAYSWTGPNGFTTNTQNPVVGSMSALKSGVYSVQITNSAGCTATSTTNVTLSTPTASITSNGPLCVGQTLNLLGSGGNTFSWTGPNTFTSTLPNPSINNVAIINGGQYNLTITNSYGCTASTSINVVINSLPSATANNNGPMCASNNLSLTASGGVTYSWAGPNGFLSTAQNPVISNISTAGNGIYSLVVTDINNCFNTNTTSVTIYSLPIPTASTSNGDVCLGQTIDLQSSGGNSYSWTGPDGFSSNSQNKSINNATLAMSGIYSVTVRTNNNCSATATVQISVHTPPLAPTASDVSQCGAGTVVISASGCTGIYKWYDTNTSLPVLGTGASFVTASLISSNNGTATNDYYVSCTEFSCPESSRKKINVTILDLPTAIAAVSGTHCVGSTAKFTGSGTNVASYFWTGPAGSGFSSNLQSPTMLVASSSFGGVYTLTTTRSNGCTATATVNLNVINDCSNICNDKYYIVPSNPSSCTSNTGVITVTANNNMEYTLDLSTWTRGSDPSSSSISNLGIGQYYFYIRDYTTKYICKNVKINLEAADQTSFISGYTATPATDCFANDGQIVINGPVGTDNIRWIETLNSSYVPFSTLSPANTITGLAAGKYYVKVSRNGEYCFSYRYIDVPSNSGACANPVVCSTSSANLFPNGDFGSGTPKNGPVLIETQYGYSNYTCYAPWDGFYSIVNYTDCDGSNHKAFQFTQSAGWWDITYDHTPGDVNGYMMVVNAGYAPNIVVEKQVDNLCPNTNYNFTCWLKNISPESTIKPNCAFIVDGVIKEVSGLILGDWQKVGFSFKTGASTTSALFAIRNIQGGGYGNNFIIDDIEITKCPLDINLSGTTVACLGGSSEDINASITDPFSEFKYYKWEKSDDNGLTWQEVQAVTTGTFVSNVLDVSLTLPTPIVSALSGRIYRIRLATTAATIDDPQCSVFSALTQIIVPPINLVASDDFEMCAGAGTVNLTATASGGTAPYTYTWSNSASGSTIAVSPANTTTYFVEARDADMCPAWDTVTVSVIPQVTVNISINTQVVCVGGSATLTATKTNGAGSFSYQWQSSTNNSSWSNVGSNSNTFSPSTASAGNTYYRVIVTPSGANCGPATSGSILFTVNPQVNVTVSADNSIVCEGGVSTISPIISNGAGNFTYQWQQSNNNSSFSNISGATDSTYSPGTSSSGTKYYRLVVSPNGSGCSVITSPSDTVNVIPKQTVTTSPNNSIVCVGGSVTINSNISGGTGTPSYQWQESSDNISFTNVASNGNNATFLPATNLAGTKYYRVLVSLTGSGCGSSTSSSSQIQVLPNFAVDITPSNLVVCQGGSATLNANPIGGTGTITYQWYKSTDNITFTILSGETNVSYNPVTTSTGILYYRVVATASGSGCGSATSASVTIEVLPTFAVNIAVDNGVVCQNGSAIITAIPTTAPSSITYQWSYSDDNVTFTYAPGNSTSLTYVAPTASVGLKYYKVAANASGSGCGIAQSASSTVEVLEIQDASISMDNAVLCQNGSATLTATVNNGTGTPTYQWQSSPDNSTWSNVGTNSDTYAANTSSPGLLYYRVQVGMSGNGCGTINSPSGTIEVLEIQDATIDIDNAVLCQNGSALLTASVNNGTGTPTYQWQSSPDNSTWSNVGTDSDTYSANTSSPGLLYYRVQVGMSGNGCGTINSPSGTIEVLEIQDATVDINNAVLCQNGSAVLTASVNNGTGTPTYQWQSSPDNSTWSNVGTNSDTYVANTSAAGLIYYRVQVGMSGNGCGTINSPSGSVEVLEIQDASISMDNAVLCQNGSATLTATVNNGTGTPTYQWQSSPDNSTWSNVGTDSDTYAANTSSPGLLYYRVQVGMSGNGCGTINSPSGTVEVLEIQDATVDIDNAVLCQNGSAVLTASVNNGTGTPTYQWQSSPDNSTWSNVGTDSDTYTSNTSSPGILYYRVQVGMSGNGCGTINSPSGSVEVLEIQDVTVNINNTILCLNGNATLTATVNNGTGIPTYQWQSSADNSSWTSVGTDSDTYIANTASTGITYYRVQVSMSGNGCGTINSPSGTVEVLPVYDVDISIDNAAVCTNGSVIITADTISGTGNITYKWFESDNNILFTEISGETNITYSPTTASAGVKYYKVEATASGSGCGTVESASNMVSVIEQLSLDLEVLTEDVCVNESVSLIAHPLNGTGTITYQWQDSADGISWNDLVGETDTILNVNTSSPGIRYYKINGFAAGEGCLDAASLKATVTKYTYPNVTVSSEHPLCVPNNGSITFNFANEPNQTQIEFSIDGGITYPYLVNDNSGSYTIDTLTDGTYTLFARWADAKCPIAIGSVILVERPSPAASVTFDDPTCSDPTGSITFSFADQSGRTALEFSLDGGINYQTAVNDNSGLVSYSNLAAGNYDLWVRWDNDECPVDLGLITLTDHPSPVLTASADSEICVGESVSLSVSSTGGDAPVIYTWNNGLSDGSNQTVAPVTDSWYFITATDLNGCSDIDTIFVKVNELPVITANGGVYCEGDTIILTSDATGTINWTGPNSFSDNVQNPQITFADLAYNGIFTLFVTDANNCSNSDTAAVTIHPAAAPPLVSDQESCGPGILNFTATNCTGSVRWYDYENSYSTVAFGTNFATPLLSESNVYFASCTSAMNCESLVKVPANAIIKETSVAEVLPVNTTCLGQVPRNNGMLIATRIIDGETYSFNVGSSYNTGTASTPATIPLDGLLSEDIPNPSAATQTYTIRIWSLDACPLDQTVEFQKQCETCLPFCEPATVERSK